MKKTLKTATVICLLFISFSTSAQTTLSEYLYAEKDRIESAQAIETEIETFVSNNMKQYELTKSLVDEITSGLKLEGIYKQDDIDRILLMNMEDELRKLYFKTYPNKKDKYIATPTPYSQRLTCINGDFETNLAANYTFTSDRNANNFQCTVMSNTNIIPTTNDFTSLVTVMDSTDPSWNPAALQFDPDLNSAEYGFIQVPTISPNGSNRSIKLNNRDGGRDVTTMSRQVFVDDNTLDYEFSLMLENSGHQGTNQEPIFTVRVLDLAGNLIQQRCILSQPDCNFTVAQSNINATRDIFYTDWVCDQIDVTALVGTPVNANGMNAIIEFVIADCGQGGHTGIVYIDNICGFTCNNPFLGIVSANPIDGSCPDIVNNTPYQVCGSYSMPNNSTLNTINIQMSQDGGITFNAINPANFTLNVTAIDAQNGTFCFDIDPSIFGVNPTGSYIFQITETFTQSCTAGIFTNINQTLATVDFANCCQPNLTSSMPISTMIQEERSDWIRSSDNITFSDGILGNGVVYHAGDFVELNPGFITGNGAQFAAYPQGCTLPQSFVYRNENTNTKSDLKNEEVEINLVKISRDFSIIPNPSSSSIEISVNNLSFIAVKITTLQGRVVFDKSIPSTESYRLDISDYQTGLYIVLITTEDNELLIKKLIKK